MVYGIKELLANGCIAYSKKNNTLHLPYCYSSDGGVVLDKSLKSESLTVMFNLLKIRSYIRSYEISKEKEILTVTVCHYVGSEEWPATTYKIDLLGLVLSQKNSSRS